MATKFSCVVAARWKSSPGVNAQEIADIVPRAAVVTDITGQADEIIPPKPNIYLCEVTNLSSGAQITAIDAHPVYTVIASASYDEDTGEILTSTHDDKPTLVQLNALKSRLQARFPDLDDDKLIQGGRSAFRAGLSRREVIGELIQRWRNLPKA